ncbi:MAG: hypothetical protein ACREQ5_20660, partial [Candidatus Dormibacteria bacterium]
IEQSAPCSVIAERVTCTLVAVLLLASARAQLHVGGYWESRRLLWLEQRHPTLVRWLGLNSFSKAVQRVPPSLAGLAIVWIRMVTVVFALAFCFVALLFFAVAVAPDLVG